MPRPQRITIQVLKENTAKPHLPPDTDWICPHCNKVAGRRRDGVISGMGQYCPKCKKQLHEF